MPLVTKRFEQRESILPVGSDSYQSRWLVYRAATWTNE